jgi:DNA-directed RNA polymerase specialized sigma24 family protein
MGEQPRSAPGRPGRGASRLQPAKVTDFEDEDLPADDDLDRRLGDTEMLLRLQLSGYADVEWLPVSAEFARYGYNVLTGWIYTGEIFDQVYAATARRLRRPDVAFAEADVVTLVSDTVVAALDTFLERVLKQNRWDPNRGASLKTFFVGQCKFQFPNALRSWERARARDGQVLLFDDPERVSRLFGTHVSADDALIRHEESLEMLERLSTDKARLAAAMYAIGYSHVEIAEQLGLRNEKSVENLLGHQRRRLGKHEGEAG